MAQSPNRKRVPSGIAILLVCWGSSGTAATIRVPSDYPSIQEGIDASSPGDTVLVAPGTYFENVTIEHGLTLLSEAGAASTIIDAQDQGTVLRIDAPGSPVVVDGFRVTGGHAFYAGIFVNANSVIRRNIIDHNDSSFGWGALRTVGPSMVEDNIIEDNVVGKGGIVWASGTIRRNIIRRNYGDLGMANLYGIVENNLIVENWDGPNGMVHASGIFRNNTVANNGWGPEQVYVSNAQEVANNLITHPLGQGRGLACGQNVQNVRCNNVVGGAGDSYFGECDGMEGLDGNISLDPQFCTISQPDYRLLPSSPCAPENSPPGCGLIGALGVCGAAGLGAPEAPSGRLQLLIDPNPITSAGSFTVDGERGESMIEIVDAHGRIVHRLLLAGSRPTTWTPDRKLANGVYFARVQTPHASSVAKFVLVR